MLFGKFSTLDIVAFRFCAMCQNRKFIWCFLRETARVRRTQKTHKKKRARKTLWHCQKVLRDLFDTRCRNRQPIAQRHQFFHRRAVKRQIRNLPVVRGDAVAPVCLPIIRCVHTVNGLVHAFASQLPLLHSVQNSHIIIVTRTRFVNTKVFIFFTFFDKASKPPAVVFRILHNFRKNGWQSDHSMVY